MRSALSPTAMVGKQHSDSPHRVSSEYPQLSTFAAQRYHVDSEGAVNCECGHVLSGRGKSTANESIFGDQEGG